ncbi:alpha-mannosidase [Caldicoprobacter guelmensis]|uniref:alpha-mannosidase n=1 Tax=Caldicoprobacter guelmensis TaxID=1170224 RepID=UPI0019571E9E|nr:alpha-mannosidase [Caldicoprobacter guelmensis]MBM7582317.1 alpha-mannosidase [Caldicoprobacter guelmensis]
MKNKKLSMIGHAHIDPVWLWQWQEGFQEVKATFRSALDRMKEYPEFKFISSSAAFYEWVEKNDPEMFEEIKKRVEEGRWAIVGGWWVEPDCNIPCGESFIRHALYGQRYFKKKFGKVAKVGFNPDSFGHNGMLPQLLKVGGIKYYVFMRPMPNEKGLPSRIFWWESDDGSRVLTFRIPYEYLTWKGNVEGHVRRCAGELKEPYTHLMCFYGVGNHGGGPTKENIESIYELSKREDMPQLVFSTPEEFFAEIEKSGIEFPVVHDDLQYHSVGCYSAHSGVKKWNRESENLLIKAEKFSALADILTGQPYPDDFEKAWKDVLFCQFHDILAGTSLEEAYEDVRNMYGEAMAIAGRNLNYAVQSISWKIDIPLDENMRPIVVFNPHSWDCAVPIEVELGNLGSEFSLLDDDGKEVAVQRIKPHAASNGRYRISFVADLPSMGYRTYRLFNKKATVRFDNIKANTYCMENGRLRLEIDPETGYISSLYDKIMGVEVFKGQAAVPVVLEDNSDTWSHNVVRYDREIGRFKLDSIRLVEQGPVMSTISVKYSYGSSTLIQNFTLYSQLNEVDVKVTVDWREQFKLLKIKFPFNLVFRQNTFEIPYGCITRCDDGREQPGQSWVDVTGIIPGTSVRYGVTIINDCKYSFDVSNNVLSMTVLRSPVYANHDPYKPCAEEYYSFIDQGLQHFSYKILPHDGGWEEAGTVKKAALFNQRPVALIETYHEGALPQKMSFLAVDVDNVVVEVVKKAEDDDDIVIRCREVHGLNTKATVFFRSLNRDIEAEFRPYEIKTFKVPRDLSKPVVETNALEWVEQC